MRAQVAGLLVRDRQLLLCLRSATRAYYPGVWDLPGGHVERGETDEAALKRELREELGIVMRDGSDAPFARIVDERAGFDLGLWHVRAWHGNPINCCPAEHDRIAWFSSDEIAGLSLAIPDYGGLLPRAIAQSE